MEPSEFEYIIPVRASRERTEKGRYFIVVKLTAEAISEIKTAERYYINLKKENFNPEDATDKREMKISEIIDNEIHHNWRLLHPGDDIRPQ